MTDNWGNNPGAEVKGGDGVGKGMTREEKLQAWAGGLVTHGRTAAKQLVDLQTRSVGWNDHLRISGRMTRGLIHYSLFLL